MAKPQPKTPRTALPTGPELAPAPDNGVDYVDRSAAAASSDPQATLTVPRAQTPAAPAPRAAAKESVRSYPQLGTRVPPALYERIQRCCTETGVTQAFLVQRGLERELTERGY